MLVLPGMTPAFGIAAPARFGANLQHRVESVIDYHVPMDKITPLAKFDASVVVERTVGEASARCHDEQANFSPSTSWMTLPPARRA